MRTETGRDAVTALVIGGLASWFVVTVASQHPQRVFDRVRRYDRRGVVIPDWRFFAPEPGQHDLQMFHRVLRAGDGVPTPWLETAPIAARRWSHAAWFPRRRQDKAMFEISNELCALVNLPIGDPTPTPAFRMPRGFAERAVRTEYSGVARGFQFMIVSSGGYDTDVEPEYLFLSPFARLESVDA